MIFWTSIGPPRARGQDQAEVLRGISCKTIGPCLKQDLHSAQGQADGRLSCPRPDPRLANARPNAPKPGHRLHVHPLHVHRDRGRRSQVIFHHSGRLVCVRRAIGHRGHDHLPTGHPAFVLHCLFTARFTVRGFGIGLLGAGDGAATATTGGPGRPLER